MRPALLCLSAALLLLGRALDNKEPPAPKLSDEEKAIIAWTNQVRVKEKLPALQAQALLLDAARAHSANMAKKKELAHELDGKDVQKRVLERGYDYAEVGENLAGGDGPVPEFYKLWLNSPVHRAHLFNGDYREIGVGLVRDAKGQLYCTVVFGLQRKKR